MKASEELEENEEDSSQDDDDDEIAHLARRILKAWIKTKKKSFVPKKHKKARPSKTRLFASNARSLDMSDQKSYLNKIELRSK